MNIGRVYLVVHLFYKTNGALHTPIVHTHSKTYSPDTADKPITILDPGCTRKTFPDYFQVLENVVQR